MLYKNYRPHVAVQWQDITCPVPSKEQWDVDNADTVKNVENRKQKKEQKRKVKLELSKNVNRSVKRKGC